MFKDASESRYGQRKRKAHYRLRAVGKLSLLSVSAQTNGVGMESSVSMDSGDVLTAQLTVLGDGLDDKL